MNYALEPPQSVGSVLVYRLVALGGVSPRTTSLLNCVGPDTRALIMRELALLDVATSRRVKGGQPKGEVYETHA